MSKQANSEVETQLVELQRKYRVMEGNRKAYSDDSQSIIKRQRATIEKLKLDNSSLKAELSLENDTVEVSAQSTAEFQRELIKLHDCADHYTRKIEMERRRLEEIEKQSRVAATKIREERARLGGVNATKENDQQIQKQVKVLENRLDKALVKFNEALSTNKDLREEIDHLRQERVGFDQIYKKLERQLHEKKREMANVIEISNIAYEARDQAHNEIAALRAQADKEQASFENEWKELGKLLDAEKKAMDYAAKTGQLDRDQEAKLRKKMIRGTWELGKDKMDMDDAAEKVQLYDEAFAKIQAATGITDIEELVIAFISSEDQNFSLFNYANELNQEVEKLEEQTAELREDVGQFKGREGESDTQRSKLMSGLELKLQRTEQKAEAFGGKANGCTRTANALKAGLGSIFNKLGLNTPDNKDLLGEGVSQKNMLQILGMIEQHSNEILRTYAAKYQGANDQPDSPDKDSKALLGQGPGAPVGTAQLNIHPPSTAGDQDEESGDEEDADDRPLTRDELQAKTMKNLSKRDSRGAHRRRPKR
ncbi:Outer dynein arm protein 1 [Cymbomonas tetramitiformis]|uniref:Outer dynein arm protein 1 n=1 Tax=Cymbomonas tetramitiformis TaxID=36881 RepID=A0AAE0G978_9CHLO|nr:Outer dynein arm protein 1 [Cymbomonas tetramitiformis]